MRAPKLRFTDFLGHKTQNAGQDRILSLLLRALSGGRLSPPVSPLPRKVLQLPNEGGLVRMQAEPRLLYKGDGRVGGKGEEGAVFWGGSRKTGEEVSSSFDC